MHRIGELGKLPGDLGTGHFKQGAIGMEINKRCKRIICLTTRFNTGGAELNALMLARAFRSHGHQVEIWSLYRSGNLDVGDIPRRIMLESSPRSIMQFIKMVKHFNQNIKQFKPDIMLGFQPLANIFGALAMYRRGRFVASQRNPASSQKVAVGILEAILGSTKLYSANIAVSEAVMNTYRYHPSAYRKRMKVIHNGLPPLPSVTDNKKSARAKLNLPQDVPMVGMIGRLHKQKNQAFIIKVMKNIPAAHLMIAGDGPDLEYLQELSHDCANRIHFIGRIDGEKISLAYRALDVFLFPSIYEGFGRSLIEAMAMDVPLIANDMPVTREVTGGLATLIPLDAKLWEAEISKALNGVQYNIDAAAIRARSFTLEAMIENYVEAVLPKNG